jgi:tetratricopeptide (TPR) repeat protein
LINEEEAEKALDILKKVEHLVEEAQKNGKEVDNNYSAILLYNLGCCYQRLGMLDEAIDYLEAAIGQLHEKVSLIETKQNTSSVMDESMEQQDKYGEE